MSQLLYGKQKGRFAAPPEDGPKRNPFVYVPIYLLLPVAIIFVAITGVQTTTFFACRNQDAAMCVGRGMPSIDGGTYTGVSLFVTAMMGVGLLLVILAAARLKRWPVVVCWILALIGAGMAVIAFFMISGTIPTPVGTVIEHRIL